MDTSPLMTPDIHIDLEKSRSTDEVENLSPKFWMMTFVALGQAPGPHSFLSLSSARCQEMSSGKECFFLKIQATSYNVLNSILRRSLVSCLRLPLNSLRHRCDKTGHCHPSVFVIAESPCQMFQRIIVLRRKVFGMLFNLHGCSKVATNVVARKLCVNDHQGNMEPVLHPGAVNPVFETLNRMISHNPSWPGHVASAVVSASQSHQAPYVFHAERDSGAGLGPSSALFDPLCI